MHSQAWAQIYRIQMKLFKSSLLSDDSTSTELSLYSIYIHT